MLSLCWRTSLGILISMFSITYHLVQNSCSYPVNGAVHFISPYVPSVRILSCKELYSRDIAEQLGYSSAHLMRLLTVPLDMRYYHRGNAMRFPFQYLSPRRQQTKLRVGSGVISHTRKNAFVLLISLDPCKRNRFLCKTPCGNQLDSLQQTRRRYHNSNTLFSDAIFSMGNACISSFFMVG